ncbi:MAG: tetratricopeptide repeat protein [Chloroflexi bacterium]|nr:tetratricopeptide repeat protein [Chloroflexota bacterium]MBU1746274.1 tetratricopeptide repeat protein [Chloroflexota bacterium]
MNEMPSPGARIIEAGWLLLAAGLPLWCAPWGRNPFELPKALLLWIAIAVMGAAWLAGCRIHDAGCTAPDAKHGVSSTSSILYPVSCLLATLFSVNPLLSTQGSYDRVQGTITLLCYLALFLLVMDRLREPAQTHRLLAAIAWGSAPVVAYGLLQAAGLDPLGWRVDGSPIISTLGRSNFLGAYLVLVLPLTLAAAYLARDWPRRAAYAALIAGQLACLLATTARAAWLGALAAGAVLVLAWAWQRGYRRLAVVSGLVGLAGLMAGLLALPLLPGLEDSIGARATIWRATLPLIAARPLLGYGPETFAQVFTSVFPPELVYLQGRAVLVDRAHNLVLDTLASTGALGLLAYMALVGTALTAGLRALAHASDRQARLVLAAGLAAAVGYLVEAQFSFPVTTTATLFWLTLGLLATGAPPSPSQRPWSGPTGAGGRERFIGPQTLDSRDPRSGISPLLQPSPAGGRSRGMGDLLAALLLLIVVPASLALLAADAYANSTDVAAVQQATTLWPTQPAYHLHLSWLHLQLARRGDNPAVALQAAEAALDAAQRLAPGDYRVWAGYGELYTEWGRWAEATEAYEQATALFPGSAMLHTGWGLCYVAQGRLADAEAQFHQAITLDNTDAWAYRYLGDMLLAQGDLAGAERAYRDALRWAPAMTEAHQGLGHVYCQQGWLDAALLAYQSALDTDPNNPDLYLDAARCAWNLGQRDQACQIAARGLLLIPNHPGLLEFQAACAQ